MKRPPTATTTPPMSKSRALFLLISVACLVPFMAASLSLADDDETDSLYKQLSVFSEVLSLIQRVYVEETAVGSLLGGALEGATDALDPLSTFIPPSAVEGYAAVRDVGASRSGLRVAKDRGIVFAAGPAKATRPGGPIGPGPACLAA